MPRNAVRIEMFLGRASHASQWFESNTISAMKPAPIIPYMIPITV